jgi:outer membrane protein
MIGGFFMLKKRSMILVLLVAFTATVFLGGCGANTGATGVLDVNKVMTESPKVKALQDQLNAKGKELSDKLEAEKAGISAEEFQKRQEAAYGEFLKSKQDLEAQFDANVKQALEQVAKEKKLGIILYKNGVAQGGTDITDDVIKKLQ